MRNLEDLQAEFLKFAFEAFRVPAEMMRPDDKTVTSGWAIRERLKGKPATDKK